MKPERALLLDVSPSITTSIALREILQAYFTIAGPTKFDPDGEGHTGEFERELNRTIRRFDPRLIFLVSMRAEPEPASALLTSLKRMDSEMPVIAVIEGDAPRQALELLELGAADFVTAPFQPTDVLARAWKVSKQFAGDRVNSSGLMPNRSKKLIGNSPGFLQQVAKIPLIAASDANVLLVGETGTGKELYARAIHYGSARAGKPFIPVNCGAIPLELVENELFGHQRGAFTSASTAQVGLIEEAHGGTLFLDEIDCLPIFAQVKLLRFLQEKEYRPLGSPRMRRANVRIIAASNLNLEEAVGNGKVRQDLFYRLNIISLPLPPLRERREDIPLLAHHFLAKYAHEAQKNIAGFSTEALQALMSHNWPGNVRELEHAIERSIVLCHQEIVQLEDLLSNSAAATHPESMREAKAKEIARFEKNYIQGLLSICRGNITRAAQVARKNRRAFWQLIQKHQIDVSRFKTDGLIHVD